MLSFLKKIFRLQHQYFPLPIFLYKFLFNTKLSHKIFYKYFTLCFDTDQNHQKPNTSEFNQSYWLSRRSLYWHYAHLKNNRFTSTFDKIFKDHNYLFQNKKVCDLMCGLGPYWRDKNLNLMLIEGNKYCCEVLKKDFPNSQVINGNWDIIEKYTNDIDTLFLSAGCLIFLNKEEVDKFYKMTSKIKNFILIREGTIQEDYSREYSGHNYWNIEKRLKKFNENYSKAKIYIENTDSGKVCQYFIFTSN